MGKKILKTAIVAIAAAGMTAAYGADEKKSQLTFLDTLNKGKELSVSNADFAPPPSAAAAKPLEPAVDTAARSAAPKQKQDPGIVLSKFRIQIVASTNQDQVTRVKNTLSSKLDLPVTMAFEPPYYRLFVGEFAGRGEAENYLAQVKKLGYNDAWISRTAVSSK